MAAYAQTKANYDLLTISTLARPTLYQDGSTLLTGASMLEMDTGRILYYDGRQWQYAPFPDRATQALIDAIVGKLDDILQQVVREMKALKMTIEQQEYVETDEAETADPDPNL